MNLPAVGQLPLLRHLELERLKGLKTVGQEFYGNGNIPFPSLETLSLYDMPELENSCYRDGGGSPFPCLRELRVSLCRKLRSLRVSNLPALQRCSINWCNEMIGIDGLEEHYWRVTDNWQGTLDLRVRGLRSIDSSMLKLEKFSGTDNTQTICSTIMIIGCPMLKKSLISFNKADQAPDDSNRAQCSQYQLKTKKSSAWDIGKSMNVRKSPKNGLVKSGIMRKVLDTPTGIEVTLEGMMQPNLNDENMFPFDEEMAHSSHEQNSDQTSPMPAVVQTSTTSKRDKILLGYSFMKSAPAIETVTSLASSSLTPPVETTMRISY